jgi:riboflavin synthase alpha subunit
MHECFEVNLVPHTLQNTILGAYGPRSRVNLEIDIIARYVERLLHTTELYPADTRGDAVAVFAT